MVNEYIKATGLENVSLLIQFPLMSRLTVIGFPDPLRGVSYVGVPAIVTVDATEFPASPNWSSTICAPAGVSWRLPLVVALMSIIS